MGTIHLNDEEQTATLFATVFFYGNAANQNLSNTIANDINEQYNAAKAIVFATHVKYKFIMQVNGVYAPKLSQVDVIENDNPRFNFFRIEEYASGNISFVDGINSNTGYFKLDNLLQHSTTAAHEFGHTIGLEHPNQLDIRGYGVPSIMYPRGTICDAEFQYDSNAEPYAAGGTMNPKYRQVLQQNITDLHIENLKFNKDKVAVIGAFTSQWHYAHLP